MIAGPEINHLEQWIASCAFMQEAIYASHEEATHNFLARQLASLHGEVAELGEELNWRVWKPVTQEPERIIEEAVDVLIFLGNILARCGITGREMVHAYNEKARYNVHRHAAR